MFEIPIDNLYFSEYIYIKEFRDVFLLGTEVLHMKELSKQLIIEMVKRIDDSDEKFLRQIYTILKRHLERAQGKH